MERMYRPHLISACTQPSLCSPAAEAAPPAAPWPLRGFLVQGLEAKDPDRFSGLGWCRCRSGAASGRGRGAACWLINVSCVPGVREALQGAPPARGCSRFFTSPLRKVSHQLLRWRGLAA